MPAQVQKSPLAAKLGAKLDAAMKAALSQEVDWGGASDPPPGIVGGIARLTSCYFKPYEKEVPNQGIKKGDMFFRAAGVIVEPESVVYNGQVRKAAGLQTSIMIPCCDTKDSNGNVVEALDHLTGCNGKRTNVINELRKMGCEFSDQPTAAELEDAVAGLAASAEAGGDPIYFRFDTSIREARDYVDPKTRQTRKGKEGVWQNWRGVRGMEDWRPSENGQVTDQTGEGPVADGAPEGPADLQDLLARAKADDEGAQQELMDLAVAAGHPRKSVEDADSWDDVAAMVEAGSPDADSGPPIPKVGDVVSYRPIDPKTGRPRKDPKTKKEVKAVECQVKAVDAAKGTVDLLSLVDRKTRYDKVKVEDLP